MKLKITPTRKQHQAYRALLENDEVFFGGAAGGGKTWWLCESRLVNCYRYPGYKSFIARDELKRLMMSTFITWNKVCKHHNIPRGDWTLNGKYNYIQFFNGSRIDLIEAKYYPSDPYYERFGSLEYSDGAIEECGEIHFLAYDVLKTRIGRHNNVEMGIRPTMALTGNPKKNWTYSNFYLPHKNGLLIPGKSFITSYFTDNPYTAEIYRKQLEGISDKSTKERLMFGNWEYEDDPTCLIDSIDINNLFTNIQIEKDEKDTKYIIVDAARYGSDRAIITVWEGMRLIDYTVKDWSAITDLQQIVNAYRVKYGVQASNVIVDEDGVGGGLVDNLNCTGFIAQAKPVDPAYYNLKSECGYKLAENIKYMFVACDMSDINRDSIMQELGMLKTYKSDQDNKLRILPKEKIKEVIGHSPDWLDVFIMRMKPVVQPNIAPQRWRG